MEDGYQISFLKDDYGEQISIYKGCDAKSKFGFLKGELSNDLVEEFETDCELTFVEVE